MLRQHTGERLFRDEDRQRFDHHRHTVEHRVAGQALDDRGVGEVVHRHPRQPRRLAQPNPRAPVAVSVRQGHDSEHDVVGGRHLDLYLSRRGANEHGVAVADAAYGQVVRVGEEGMARPAPGEPAGVVQPRVVVALVAPPDEEQLSRGEPRAGGQLLGQSGQGLEHDVHSEVDSLVGGPETFGQAGPQRSVVGTGRHPLELGDGQPCSGGAEQCVDLAARRQSKARLRRERGPRPPLAQTATACPDDGDAEIARDLPVVTRPRGLRQERRRPPRGVPHGQEVEDEVVVLTLERRRRRQDDVGVASGLVDVEVDRDHGVEAGKCLVEPLAAGGGGDGVPGDGQQSPHLAVPRCRDLLGEGRHGQLAPEARQPPYPGATPPEAAGRQPALADEVDRRSREHRSSRPVEVAGEDVDHLDRPLAHHPVDLGGDPHASVNGGRRCRGEVVRQRADCRGRHPAHVLRELGRERRHRLPDLVHAVDVCRRPSEALDEQLADDGEEDGGVGPGPDEMVLVGDRGGLGAAWVDDDEPPAAIGELATALREVGDRPQRAVRCHRVVADEDEEVGAVDVGHGEEVLVTVERPCRDLVRELVDRRRGVAVPRPEQAHEGRVVRQGAEAVHVGVAEVDREGVVPVLALDVRQLRGREGDGLRPRHLVPALAGAHHWPAQPVGVVLDVLEREGLRTDVSARQRVGLVPSDRRDRRQPGRGAPRGRTSPRRACT